MQDKMDMSCAMSCVMSCIMPLYGAIEERLDKLEKRFTLLDRRADDLSKQVNQLHQHVQETKRHIQSVRARVCIQTFANHPDATIVSTKDLSDSEASDLWWEDDKGGTLDEECIQEEGR
jgi:hypothetical protein